MSQKTSYLVDLKGYKFDDSEEVSWVQAFPLGKWTHPTYGEISMDAEKAKQFAANVNAGVRGQDLNIDYDHKTGEAAGWVKQAEARSDGLWLGVSWTPTAKAQLKEQKYRYFSPEFEDEWADPRTPDNKIANVLNGGALTNRPFLKGILPINLSEAFAEATGGNVTSPPAPPAPPTNQPKPKKDKTDSAPVQLTEQQLLEIPAIKALMESNTALQAQVKTLAEKAQLAEADATLQKFTQPVAGGKYVLSEAALGAARKALTDPTKTGEAMIELLDSIHKGSAVVELGERGVANGTKGKADDSIKKFTDAVEAAQNAHKLSYADAALKIAAEQPGMYSAYMEATMTSDVEA